MKTTLPVFLLLALATPALAGAVKLGDLTIDNAWARATPKGAPVGAGYLTIRNDGATADRLTAIAADFAAVQVHEMKMDNGVMHMREIAGGLAIPAHGAVALKPSGEHLMFTGLKHPLVKGQTAHLTLTFEHAGQVAVDLPITGVGSSAPDDGMKGMKM